DERGERRCPEFGRVVDEEIQTTHAANRGEEVASMLVFRDITRNGADGCAGGLETFHRLEQRSFVPRREDEGPTLPREKLRDGVAEAAARPRDQGDVFGLSGRPRIRTLRHIRPRPSAIYLASRLQNVQTANTVRTEVASAG